MSELEYLRTRDALLERHGEALRACVGELLEASWVAWDRGRDAWVAEEAVVLRIAGQTLAVVCWRFNKVALAWNSVDLGARPGCIGVFAPELLLEWRRDALPQLRAAVGQRVLSIYITEYILRITNLKHPEMKHAEPLILHGLELQLETGWLNINNGLSASNLLYTQTPPALLRAPVWQGVCC